MRTHIFKDVLHRAVSQVLKAVGLDLIITQLEDVDDDYIVEQIKSSDGTRAMLFMLDHYTGTFEITYQLYGYGQDSRLRHRRITTQQELVAFINKMVEQDSAKYGLLR